MQKKLTWLCALCLLTGCQQSSMPDVDGVKQQLDIPASWQHAQSAAQPLPSGQQAWWTTFNDPQLNKLVAALLARNNNLAAAVYRLHEAQLNAGLADSQLLPDVAAGLDGTVGKQVNTGQPSRRAYSGSLSLRYELDIWQKIAASRDMAHWEATATGFDLAAARLKLTGSALELYWRQQYLLERLQLEQRNADSLARLQQIASVRFRLGEGSRLEVLQAEQDQLWQQQQQTQLRYLQQENLRALAILFNQPPGAPLPCTIAPADKLMFTPLTAPLPASILARRPDLQAAEYRLRRKLTNIGVTQQSFYPTLVLNSSLSSGGGRDLMKVLHDPIGTVGGAILFPFVHFNEMRLKTRVAEMQYSQSIALFKDAFYTALKEVEDALASRQRYYEEQLSLQHSAAMAERTLALAELAWQTGQLSLKEVLTQRQALARQQQQLAENRMNRNLAEMKLWLAIGGGS
ncbi:efflux transporter outer membrane subunit [Pantoea cypripedii]|uniref:efflux transporter outer membrane subunit n=1 Tax=Pantoea cypripedii TaxID=55209 RepID=UPI002FCB4CF4